MTERWFARPQGPARKTILSYLAAWAVLMVISLPDALFPYGVSKNQPGFFHAEATSHPLSGSLWLVLVVLIWLLWFRLVLQSREESSPALRWLLLLPALVMLPFGWRAMSNDPMEYWLWSFGQVHFHLNPLAQVLGNTHWAWALRQSSWPHHPNPYGPLFWLWEWFLGHLPGVVYFWFLKLVALAGYAGAIPLLERLIRRAGRRPYWVLVAWGNPLVILEVIGGLHNDILLFLPALGALLLLERPTRRAGLAGVLLGLSLAVKPVFALALPALGLWTARRWGFRRVLAETAGALAGSLVWFAVYGSPWTYLTWNLRYQTVITGYSLAVLFYQFDHGLAIRILGVLVWLAMSVWVAWQDSPWWAATVAVAVAFLGMISWVEPWYLVEVLPGLVVYGSRRLLWIVAPVAVGFEITYGITMIGGFSSRAVSYWLVALAGLGLVIGQFWPTLGLGRAADGQRPPSPRTEQTDPAGA